MKVSLVVAQGVHTGKIIPISSGQFLIGRDPQCNLRPASPSISKQHCGVFVRDGHVFLKDFGSTNGTFINDVQLSGEKEVNNGDKLKFGPLEFTLAIEGVPQKVAAKATQPAAAKAAVGASGSSPGLSVPSDPGSEDDSAAAMLMSMEDPAAKEPTAEASIPDGSTVMDIPAVEPKADALQKVKQAQGDTSKAAADLLSKYMRRPRS